LVSLKELLKELAFAIASIHQHGKKLKPYFLLF
jgi:hypothetical protein